MFTKIRKVLFDSEVSEDRFDSLCFNLILFDVFFIPLFPLFSVSVSLPLLLYWFLKRGKRTYIVRERKYFPLVVILMVFSTLFSVFDFEGASYNTDVITSAKRCIQYITSFMYYFFFAYFFMRYKRSINNIVFWGIIYITLYALLYTINQDAFIHLKQIICPFDPQVKRWLQGNQLLVYRFNYLWADPNNVAYASTTMSLFYFIEEKKAALKKYLVLLCLIYILVCTMSIGGIGVAVVLLSYLFVFTNSFRTNTSTIVIGLIILSGCVGYIIYNFDFFYQLIESSIGLRMDLYDTDGISGGGGRGADLITGLRKFNPLFLFIGSGKEGFVTEIGHIYVWYMYGLPVYIYFLYMLFRKRKRQLLKEWLIIIPMFVGFTMNIAIGEQKYLLLLLLFNAYYTAKSSYSLPCYKALNQC